MFVAWLMILYLDGGAIERVVQVKSPFECIARMSAVAEDNPLVQNGKCVMLLSDTEV